MRWSALSLLLSLLAALPAHAQDLAPREGLNDPSYRRNVAWSQRSLAGPRAEIVMGSVMMVTGPVVGLTMVVLNALDDVLDCSFEADETAEARCQNQRQEDQRRRSIIGTTSIVGLTLGGGVLFGHGVYSIRRIRVARRELGLEYARIEATREGAQLQLKFAF